MNIWEKRLNDRYVFLNTSNEHYSINSSNKHRSWWSDLPHKKKSDFGNCLLTISNNQTKGVSVIDINSPTKRKKNLPTRRGCVLLCYRDYVWASLPVYYHVADDCKGKLTHLAGETLELYKQFYRENETKSVLERYFNNNPYSGGILVDIDKANKRIDFITIDYAPLIDGLIKPV